jgi:glycosyltransferase involved in cell wall biosynthesis
VYRYPSLLQASCPLEFVVEYGWAFVCTAILSMFIFIRHGFDIIHSANPPDIFALLAWPFKLFGKRFVFDEHDVCPELYESKFQRQDLPYRALLAMEKFSYRAADLVISTNQSYCDIARQRGGVPANRSAIVRNGVDLNYFHMKKPCPDLKGPFRYMAAYLGVMGKQDGVDRIIRAAHHLVHTLNRRDLMFVLIGKGECWDELRKLAIEMRVDHVVRFVGRIPDELLLDYLSTADVCLAPDPPDRMNQLSTMTKVLEYMACQRPIISLDLVEARRSAGDAAVYVDEDDPRSFGQAINDLLEDAPRRERMGRTGLERTVHLIGWNRSLEALLEAYARLDRKRVQSANPQAASDCVS